MGVNANKVHQLIQDIDTIISKILEAELKHAYKIREMDQCFRKSAKNLIHYRALRTMDISQLQKQLSIYGLSSLTSIESHVLSNLKTLKYILQKLIGVPSSDHFNYGVSIKKAKKTQRRNAKNLLGYRSKGRRVRIMVTLPSEAAYNYDLVHDLIHAGMNTVRINCAHDGPEQWTRMIENVAKAKHKLKKNCRITMDLAGPKIRTGPMEPGAKIRRIRTIKNKIDGKKIASINLVPNLDSANENELPVDKNWLNQLKLGDQIHFLDTSYNERTCVVEQVDNDRIVATSVHSGSFQTGTLLHVDGVANGEVGELPGIEQSLLLKKGDHLRIIKEQKPGQPALLDENGEICREAFISCTAPEIFDYVKEGDKIQFNDGKIAGKIKRVLGDEMLVEILLAKETGSNLRADKGINLPETNLRIGGLTDKDRKDLEFIVQHADVVNVSFVNSPDDVKDLFKVLKELGVKNRIGVILKIETQRAYNNLTGILLEGMKNYPLGIMIARGDLAVETGWENIARIQREILLMCNAGHIPDVWATQVLESLAKKGVPSRSEITDAATALNADCVMLNKGPYILETVKLLDSILRSLNRYQDKNKKMYPIMEEACNSEYNWE
jgi:pyruvate kinase